MVKKVLDVPTPTAEEIAKKWKLTVSLVKRLIAAGEKIEREHTNDPSKANEIARDHLGERPDYYKKLAKMEKSKIVKEESGVSGVGGVRGLGYFSGDPAVGVDSYINSNAMSYQDENGNKLEWIKKKHSDLHNKGLGFEFFDPTGQNKRIAKSLKEGISAGPARDVMGHEVGDYGGSRTPPVKLDVKEDIKGKAKKAVATGLTLANIATLGQVAGGAAEGRGSPKRDVLAAATGLPGKLGWGATGVHYSVKGMDKVKQHIRDKKKMQEEKKMPNPCWKGFKAYGMKKKNGKEVPNCVPMKEHGGAAIVPDRYTERPTYEDKSMGQDLPQTGLAGRITQEGSVSIGHRYDWAGDVNHNAKFYGDKPKATTTKNDEKDDTYKDSNKNKKVRFAKTVKEARDKRIVKRDEPLTITKRNDPLEQRKGKNLPDNNMRENFLLIMPEERLLKAT